MSREHRYADHECWCVPRCMRLCSACEGEMCEACDWVGAVEGEFDPEGLNIFVHRGAGDRLGRAAALRLAVEAVIRDRDNP